MSGLTRDQIITLVLSRLGKRENNAYLVAAAQTELALIQDTKLEQGPLLPWFLLSSEQTINLSASAGRLAAALPTDFLREWDEWPLSLYDSTTSPATYTDLIKDDYDLNLSKYGNQIDTPVKYSLVGSNIAVFPMCSIDKTARLVYFQKQPALDNGSNTTNAWTQHASDLLIGMLGEIMATMYVQSPLAPAFSNAVTAAANRLQAETIARLNAARESFRGS